MLEFERLKAAIGDLDEDTVKEMLAEVSGAEEAQAAMTACQQGLEVVGQLFEDGEYFVGDLIYAGELMQDAVQTLKPFLVAQESDTSGRMLFCTVKGDLHDIGKNIVRSLLEASGMEVVDLGVDVPPERIVETVKSEGLHIVALSGVLTLAVNSMKATVDALRDAGLRDSVKIIRGGAPVTQEANDIVGADAWTKNPQETVRYCTKWAAELA